MPFCGNCGAESPTDKLFCADCGAAIQRAATPGPYTNKTVEKPLTNASPDGENTSNTEAAGGCLLLLGLAAFFTWLWWPESTPSVHSPPDTRPGNFYKTTQQTICGRTDEDTRTALRALTRNDKAALAALVRRGDIYILEPDTIVRWIYVRETPLVEVKIDSGEHTGRTCFALIGTLDRAK